MALPRDLTPLVLAAWLLSGCGAYEAIRGGRPNPPTQPVKSTKPATPKPDEPRWVLIRNPRYGGTMAEPEYVWVEEGKIPGTFTTALFGKHAVLAPREEIAKHGPPPDGGKVSPLQGGPPLVASRGPTPLRSARLRPELKSEEPPVQEVTPRGYVIFIQKRLIVVDLTSADGVKKGSILSLRRERVPLTHPVTGEYLGELDEEIGTARVVELRERFTVGELQEVRPGYEPRVKDRVVVKPE